jgi:phosphatidylinositol-3-phosphatase
MMAFMRCKRGWLPASLAVAALMLAGCGASGHGLAVRPAHKSGPSARTFAGALQSPAAASAPGTPASAGATSLAPGARVPQPRHIVVVIMENHSYREIIGNPASPFINRLARRGALFTQSYAITHPSEPNYLALFSGSTHGLSNDSCPHRFPGRNLAADLIAAGRSFTGYAERLPSAGSAACVAGEYARKHAPWTDFSTVPRSAGQPFTRFPGHDFARLASVSFVVPDLCHDMHDCGVRTGDAWLRTHMAGFAGWAMTHDSLLILTWDENDGSRGNHIPTIFVGQMIRPGIYRQRITHYSVLRTIEDAYRLRHDGHAAAARPITDVWRHS